MSVSAELHLAYKVANAPLNPKDPDFACPGAPHYHREKFDKMVAMPFAPNSLFVFTKTNNSFHGVEPVGDPDCRRWLLLYDIHMREKK
jgi:hypothetical protein